ncbi:MAG: ABC transporter permease, partial [Atopobiaceae bacterium]|nr:ABC transporter permease [Atopobiaceae bacterium]
MDSKTISYIIKRIVMALFTLWAVITITFFVMKAVPGDPFASEKAVTPAARAALEAKYGLDKPLFEQYLNYLSGAVHFDFGPSLKQRGREVTDIILDGMKTSARLGVIALIIATVTGILLGAVAALRRNTL